MSQSDLNKDWMLLIDQHLAAWRVNHPFGSDGMEAWVGRFMVHFKPIGEAWLMERGYRPVWADDLSIKIMRVDKISSLN